MPNNKKEPSLHLFFKTFFDGVKTQQESLLELQNTLIEFKIANMSNAESLVFESDNGKFNLKCIISDKRSYSFINSIDDKSSNKRTDSDHIREYLYTFFCADNFSVIVPLADYFKKFCSFSSSTYAFFEDFCKNSFDNSDKQRELTNFMESLGSDSLRTAWMFVLLCFLKTPSKKNTDYRLLLLNKILQSNHSESEFQPLDITGNDRQIEKINNENIGRSEELEEIKKEMLANNTVLVYGIGGIGKSYICSKLFWNYYDCFSDGIEYLAWIQYNGDLTQSVTSSFYDPETNLDNIRKKYENHPVIGDMFVKLALTDKPDDKMKVIKEYFSKLDSKLLVFIDNADTMTKEEKKWLNSCKCRMIITSRQIIDGFYGVNINSPSPTYCKEMYIRESRGNNWEGYSLDEEKYINKITELANYHTQTVMLIAKAQYCLGLSSEEMLDELNNTGFVLKGNDEIIDTEEYELTMAEHLTKIFNLLNVTDETQLKTIRLFSLLAPNTPIKKRDIKKWFELKSLTSINELVKYGWLNSSGSEYVSIHPVIADVVKYNYKPDFEFAFPLINALQEEMKVADDYIKKNAVIVHAVAVNDNFRSSTRIENVMFVFDIASVYHYLAQYHNAIYYWQKILNLNIQNNCIDSDIIAKVSNQLALSLTESGKYNEAIPYYIQSITLFKKSRYSHYSELVATLDNTGINLSIQGRFDEALDYYNQALEIGLSKLDERHNEISKLYHNIGTTYSEKGEYSKSYEYYTKALDIELDIYGPNHKETAFTYNNIGIILNMQGEYKEAFELFQKALDIQKSTLGHKHPEISRIYNSMASLFYNQKNYRDSLEYFKRSLDIAKELFSPNHRDIAIAYHNIAEVNMIMGNYSESFDNYTKAINIQEQTLGQEHPETAASYDGIASLLYLQKEYSEAIDYYSKAIKAKEKVFGTTNYSTSISYRNIADLYTGQSKYDMALCYYKKALSILICVLGKDNPETIETQTKVSEIEKLLSEQD